MPSLELLQMLSHPSELHSALCLLMLEAVVTAWPRFGFFVSKLHEVKFVFEIGHCRVIIVPCLRIELILCNVRPVVWWGGFICLIHNSNCLYLNHYGLASPAGNSNIVCQVSILSCSLYVLWLNTIDWRFGYSTIDGLNKLAIPNSCANSFYKLRHADITQCY